MPRLDVAALLREPFHRDPEHSAVRRSCDDVGPWLLAGRIYNAFDCVVAQLELIDGARLHVAFPKPRPRCVGDGRLEADQLRRGRYSGSPTRVLVCAARCARRLRAIDAIRFRQIPCQLERSLTVRESACCRCAVIANWPIGVREYRQEPFPVAYARHEITRTWAADGVPRPNTGRLVTTARIVASI